MWDLDLAREIVLSLNEGGKVFILGSFHEKGPFRLVYKQSPGIKI